MKQKSNGMAARTFFTRMTNENIDSEILHGNDCVMDGGIRVPLGVH